MHMQHPDVWVRACVGGVFVCGVYDLYATTCQAIKEPCLVLPAPACRCMHACACVVCVSWLPCLLYNGRNTLARPATAHLHKQISAATVRRRVEFTCFHDGPPLAQLTWQPGTVALQLRDRNKRECRCRCVTCYLLQEKLRCVQTK